MPKFNQRIKVLLFLPLLLGSFFLLFKFSSSQFADSETVSGNSIQAGVWGTTSPTETPLPTSIPTPTPTTAPTRIVINEVEYDTHQSGTDSDYEWFELYNNTSSPIILSGWTITDNVSSDTIPDLTLPANGFAVVAATESGFMTNYPSFSGLVVYISGGSIGNGLSNTDDRLILKDETATETDAVSWGTDSYAFGAGNGVSPATGAGHSIARIVNGQDTDSKNDWQKLINPTPGL